MAMSNEIESAVCRIEGHDYRETTLSHRGNLVVYCRKCGRLEPLEFLAEFETNRKVGVLE